ncbi:MAG: hypothetical protein LBR91_03880 [Puniceicoccales bacterium]|jgi:hypothetical protein|nr:hypothetical protein [Puniceicoccales bacterium]
MVDKMQWCPTNRALVREEEEVRRKIFALCGEYGFIIDTTKEESEDVLPGISGHKVTDENKGMAIELVCRIAEICEESTSKYGKKDENFIPEIVLDNIRVVVGGTTRITTTKKKRSVNSKI